MKPLLLLLLLLPINTAPLMAEELRIAVASNFSHAMKALAAEFETVTGHQVTLSIGSTGKQYAQIKQGAPFDLYFAADSKRPMLLEQQGIAIANSRFTYALGKLALWSSNASLIDQHGWILNSDTIRYLAIANPKLAPYGQAAVDVLANLGLVSRFESHLVRGSNIAQTFQFVASGNADAGFVAYSLITQLPESRRGSYWLPPDSLYKAIRQDAVLLSDSPSAGAFVEFVSSGRGKALIRAHGYETP